jgi:hypothetical protein
MSYLSLMRKMKLHIKLGAASIWKFILSSSSTYGLLGTFNCIFTPSHWLSNIFNGIFIIYSQWVIHSKSPQLLSRQSLVLSWSLTPRSKVERISQLRLARNSWHSCGSWLMYELSTIPLLKIMCSHHLGKRKWNPRSDNEGYWETIGPDASVGDYPGQKWCMFFAWMHVCEIAGTDDWTD